MSRRGFTLVELLVVTGIFSVLFAMVLSGARPSASGQVRRAAQQIASVLLSTQSKALGNTAGAGVIFDPVAGGASVTNVSAADMLPWITGVCSGTLPPTNPAATTATVPITPDNADAADLADGYKIRFHLETACTQAPTAWMEFKSSSVVTFRAAGGQTPSNTVWPKLPTGGVFRATIARYPNMGETLLQLPKAAAIDLRYSGIGDGATFTAAWSALSGKGAIAVCFDSTGAVDGLMQQVLTPASRNEQPLVPTQLIYLFVAPRVDVDSGANTLSLETAMWVVLDPRTGRVSVAANVPSSGTDASALRSARAKARAGVAFGK